jgi:serine/threonine protein kinase/tetratricopeptide (TPR) repeat protein
VAERPLGTADTLAGSTTITDSGMEAARVVGGRYQILGLVGSGGMGSVYRARDLELEETVALKLLRRELVDAPAMLARFRQEVKLARRVTHTNIARVFDIGEEGADKFLTMEYVDGEPLSSLIAKKGALPLDELRSLSRPLCEGLSAAHSAGVVHRDLKPDNILLAATGRLVITDFGIARAFLESDGAGRTQGGILGTPAYMAPEQVEGLADIDERADLYALGAVLFELATGERAWRGEAVLAVAAARLTQPAPDPRSRRPLPDALAQVIVQCLARRREDRPPTARAVGAALEEAFASVSRWTPLPAPHPSSLPSRTDKSVAVLPFKYSGPAAEDYVAEGLTEDLVDTLSMTRGLRVRPHSVVARLEKRDDDPRAVGRALDVQVIVEGSVKKSGEHLRVSARAIHVSDGFQIWAHRFDAAPGDLLMISDRMAHAIAAALTTELSVAGREGPADPALIDLYLRARRELRNAWNGDPRVAIELFDRAVVRAPDDANIVANRALALTRGAFIYGGDEALETARAAAERAVAVAPELGESWAALSSVRMYRGDTVAGAEALRAGLLRAPTSPRLHENVGRLQAEVGLVELARRHFETALRLDPTLSDVQWDMARMLALGGDWGRAEALLEYRAEDDAAFLGRTVSRARVALWRGRLVEVPPELTQHISAQSLMVQLLVHAQGLQRNGAVTDETLERVAFMAQPHRRRLSSFLWQLYSELSGCLGQTERVLDGIDRALMTGLFDVHWMHTCPSLNAARSQPAFAALLARVEANAAPVRAMVDSV